MRPALQTPPPGFDELTADEQVDYVQALWDRIAAREDQVSVPGWHRAELSRRLADHQADREAPPRTTRCGSVHRTEESMPEKDEVARLLADAHRALEPAISLIIRLITDREGDVREPVKLLEVNPATSPSGILPIAFTADPPQVPYPSVVVEVTELEYEQIRKGTLPLPPGWRIGEILYPAVA